MRRSTALRRRGPMKRGKPMKKRNAKRRESEFARCYGSKARVVWVTSLPCVLCQWSNALQMTRSQNAHTVNDGKGRKAGYETIIPLCNAHHRLYDGYVGVFAVPDVREAMKREAVRVNDEWNLVNSR